MRSGQVLSHQALFPITFHLSGQPDIEIEFVVDTGFIGYLTLPASAVLALNLPFLRRMPVNLADDSSISVGVHAVTILWQGQLLDVEALATGSRPLLGTLLVEGHNLHIQFADGGLVTIDPL